MALNEDTIYRASSQYRLWSFSKESLTKLRSKTNALAASRVRAAIQRSSAEQAGSEGTKKDVECLTVEEELKLVGYYCTKAMDLADLMHFPTTVKATAVQYLKRFYLSNSPMTYHPKSIVLSALFLSTKTENHYTSLRSFASQIPKTSPEDVLATEFLVTQGLRFTFDVRHPQRGLEGGFMELLAIADTHGTSNSFGPVDASSLAEEMLQVTISGSPVSQNQNLAQLKSRIQKTHGKASEILKTSALLTDAYFLYTPAQIWLSALMAVDAPLAEFYINSKFQTETLVEEDPRSIERLKVLNTIKECSTLLSSPSTAANPSPSEIAELTRIDKKLFHCRNPEKIDLVGLNKAQKREGGANVTGDNLDEKIIKKRKLEREKSAKDDDVFGGDLIK